MDKDHNTVQRAVTKTISKKKKCKKANGCLRRPYKTEKRREVKCKEEKERCTYLNAEFQRTARRDEKDFLNEQCKEIRGKQ